jgi:phospholipid transport system substrate-binding protein
MTRSSVGGRPAAEGCDRRADDVRGHPVDGRLSRALVPGIVLGLVLLSPWAPAASGRAHASSPAAREPMAVVKTMVDEALAILRNDAMPTGRRQQELRDLITPVFDFATMSRFALGTHWRSLDAQQREEFIGVFTDFIQDSYLTRINEYAGEEVAFGKVLLDGNEYAQVHTTIVGGRDRATTAVNYRVERAGDTWKIYDVTVDNLSILANYRNQFNRVMNKNGYPTLIADLRKKQQALSSSLGGKE